VHALLLALALAGAPPAAPSSLAAAIDRAALETRRPENLRREGGKVLLYGQRTNGPDTRGGKLACAKVVSIVLREAGVKLEIQFGVVGVEQALRKWQKVTDEDEVRPGDVVVWTSRLKGNRSRACTGGGTCHVGIRTSEGYFHNDPLGDSPTFGGLGLLGYRFKVAFRPP
jgi:hypothetical protein